MAQRPIYLDYNATTPVDPGVVEAMLPYLREHFGNPSSTHAYGAETKRAIERARAQVAGLIGCRAEEILFTSGGSEANNMVIKGVATSLRSRGRHVITSAVEHPAVLEPCNALEAEGFEITVLPVDGERAGQSRGRRARDLPADHPDHDHARQQRGRHDRADRAHHRDRKTTRRARAHRCRAVGGQDPGGRGRPRRGLPEHRRAQALCTQGCRGALRPVGFRTAESDPRRGSRVGPPRRHRERAGRSSVSERPANSPANDSSRPTRHCRDPSRPPVGWPVRRRRRHSDKTATRNTCCRTR